MKPVDQTQFGLPGDGAQVGNCFAACIASLFDLPLADVPNFVEAPGDWVAVVNEWLRPRGFWMFSATVPSDWKPSGYALLAGRSPRAREGHPEDLHQVIALDGEIVHDPHPSRAGILDRQEWTFLVALDPANPAPAILERHAAELADVRAVFGVSVEEIAASGLTLAGYVRASRDTLVRQRDDARLERVSLRDDIDAARAEVARLTARLAEVEAVARQMRLVLVNAREHGAEMSHHEECAARFHVYQECDCESCETMDPCPKFRCECGLMVDEIAEALTAARALLPGGGA